MLMPMPKLWLLLLDGHHQFMSREPRFDSWIMSHMWTTLTQILSGQVGDPPILHWRPACPRHDLFFPF
jgi:hypothetical protein